MRWIRISFANIRKRYLSSILAILLMAFGVGIVSLLMQLNRQLEKQFTLNIRQVDMVVGAKGSPLQLILSGIYHIDAPTGNIKQSELTFLENNPMVKEVIPLSLGDNYRGYRIVGTTKAYPEHYGAEIADGKWFEEPMEVCIGANLANRQNMKIGDRFIGTHGLSDDGHAHEDQPYTVVGILKPSGTAVDNLILTPLESVWAVHASHDHGHEGHEGHDDDDHAHDDHDHDHAHEHEHDHHHHEADREITLALVKFKSAMGRIQLPRRVNAETNMQAALPAIEVNRLLGLMGVGITTLKWLAWAIMFLSAISVFVALFNSLRERKYEMALLRSMGASRVKLFSMVLSEGILLAFIGYIVGLLMSRGLLAIISHMSQDSYRYALDIWQFHPQELGILALSIGIGLLAAFLPALRAYKTRITEVLGSR